MKLLSRQVVPSLTVGGTTIPGHADSSRGATELSLWRSGLSPGRLSPRQQQDVEEVLLVVEGRAVAVVDGTRSTTGAGDCLILSARRRLVLISGDEQPVSAFARVTAGGQATTLPDGATSVPRWAE